MKFKINILINTYVCFKMQVRDSVNLLRQKTFTVFIIIWNTVASLVVGGQYIVSDVGGLGLAKQTFTV